MLKIKKQIRRRFEDEEIIKICVVLPTSVYNETIETLETQNPDVFYSLSHLTTCALIKQNREFKHKSEPTKKRKIKINR